jgi:hypothetical protein
MLELSGVRRFSVGIIVALLAFSVSGVSALLVPEPCAVLNGNAFAGLCQELDLDRSAVSLHERQAQHPGIRFECV